MEHSTAASNAPAVAIVPPTQPINWMQVKMEVSQLNENNFDDVESTSSEEINAIADGVSSADATAPRESAVSQATSTPAESAAAPTSTSTAPAPEQPAAKPKATRVRTRQNSTITELLAAVNNLKPVQKILWERNIPCPQLTGVPKTVEFLTNLLLEMEKCIHAADLDIPENIFSNFLVQNGKKASTSASASKSADNKTSEPAPSTVQAPAAVAASSASSPPESAPSDAAPSVSSNSAPENQSENSSRNWNSQSSEVDDFSLSAQISSTTSLVSMSFNVFKLSKLIQEDPNNSELHRLSLELTKQTHSRLAQSLKNAGTAQPSASTISTSTVPVISTTSVAAVPVASTPVASSSAPPLFPNARVPVASTPVASSSATSLFPNSSSSTSNVVASVTPLSSSFVAPSAPVANPSIAAKRVFSALAPSVSPERRPEARKYPLPVSQPQPRLQADAMAIDLLGDEDSFSSQSMMEILTGSKNRWLK